MGYQLAPGERVILLTRPQAGSLVVPALLFILIPALCAFAAGWLTRNRATFEAGFQPWITAALWAVVAIGVVLVLLYCLRPLLRWLGTQYVLTNRKLISRRGWLHRSERESPLVAVRQIGSHQSVRQRALRCGNITLDMGNGHSARFVDVPEVARFRSIVARTIEDLPRTAMFDGADFGYELDRPQDSWERDGWDRPAHGPGEHSQRLTDGTDR